MATYAVGDLQGGLKPLECLLESANFSWQEDTLWLVGDVINRGPESLQTLRYLHQHRERVVCVLGNHDLNLLAIASELRTPSPGDTMAEILAAPDREELLDWLRHRPLLHTDAGYTMVHAGIPPMWTLAQAQTYAAEVEQVLQSDNYLDFIANMYGNTPGRWEENLSGHERLRTITNSLTRIRFFYPDGSMDLENKGALPVAGQGEIPWYNFPNRATEQDNIIFGHWASLDGKADHPRVYALDTGCVWGRSMTMLCLDTGQLSQCECN